MHLPSPNTSTTMSSREIAELTGKRHDHVLVDIRRMLDELGLHSPDFSGEYRDGTGRALPIFNLNRELTDTLLTGYSIPLRHKVILRWRELEAGAQQAMVTLRPNPRLEDIANSLRLGLIDQAEATRRAQAILDGKPQQKRQQALPQPKRRPLAEPSGAGVIGLGDEPLPLREIAHWVKGGHAKLIDALVEGGFLNHSGRPTAKGLRLCADSRIHRTTFKLKATLVAIGAWPSR